MLDEQRNNQDDGIEKAPTLKPQTVGKGALHLTLAKITTTAIAFVSSMLLSRFRSLSEYGTYSQIITIITLSTSLFMLGLPNSSNFFLARADSSDQRREFLSVYYTLNAIICALIGGSLIMGLPLIERYFDIALYPFAHITISSISNVLVVYGQTHKLMCVNISTSLVALVSITIIQLFDMSFNDYLKVFLFGNLAIALWNYRIVYTLEKGIKPCVNINLIRKIFSYSIPIGLATLVGTINIELDKLVIGRMLGPESFAIYSNAGKELPLTMISASLTSVLLPQMARRIKNSDVKSAIELWGKTIELSYIAMCFFATALFVFAPQIMSILYSEKYLPGVSVFRIYSLILLLRTTYFGIVLNSSGKTKYVFWTSVLTLLINVLLNIGFYFSFGFSGPAVASLISIAICNICQLLITCRMLRIPFLYIFPWKKLGVVSINNFVWGVIAYVIIRILKWSTDIKSILFCVLFGIGIATVYLTIYSPRLKDLWNSLNRYE